MSNNPDSLDYYFPQTYVNPDAYTSWAGRYEGDTRKINYRAPERLAELLLQFQSCYGKALDIGCGTGLLVAAIHSLGNDTLEFDGCDPNAEMLALARAHGFYHELFNQTLDQFSPLKFQYDLITACGVFASDQDRLRTGDPDYTSLQKVSNLLTKSGLFAYTLSEHVWERNGKEYQAIMDGPMFRVAHHSISDYHDKIPLAHYIILQKTTN